jgi:hypothetical protein
MLLFPIETTVRIVSKEGKPDRKPYTTPVVSEMMRNPYRTINQKRKLSFVHEKHFVERQNLR